jgi:hypothetical protein
MQDAHALSLEDVDELRRRRDRDRRSTEVEAADDRRDHAIELIRRAPELERLRGRAHAAIVVDDGRLRVGAADVESDRGQGGRWNAAIIRT